MHRSGTRGVQHRERTRQLRYVTVLLRVHVALIIAPPVPRPLHTLGTFRTCASRIQLGARVCSVHDRSRIARRLK